MNAAARRKALRLSQQTGELARAAPQVVAHRVARLALAGHRPSQRDRREFQRMGAEKLAAFGEAWQAMALQLLQAQSQLAASMWQGGWGGAGAQPWARRPAPNLWQAWAAAWQSAALDVLNQGIAPVRRRASANARRLGRQR